MSSPFGDDAEFPDRPDTLDFWRLAQVNMKMDGAVQAGVNIPDTLSGLIDQRSLLYTARQRCEVMVQETTVAQQIQDPIFGKTMLIAALMAAYVSGVVAGIEFQKEGGHRDG